MQLNKKQNSPSEGRTLGLKCNSKTKFLKTFEQWQRYWSERWRYMLFKEDDFEGHEWFGLWLPAYGTKYSHPTPQSLLSGHGGTLPLRCPTQDSWPERGLMEAITLSNSPTLSSTCGLSPHPHAQVLVCTGIDGGPLTFLDQSAAMSLASHAWNRPAGICAFRTPSAYNKTERLSFSWRPTEPRT